MVNVKNTYQLVEQISGNIAYPFQKGYDFYLWCNSFGDPRTDDWPLMSSPFPTLIILVGYLSMVRYGPKMMRRRKAFDLRWPLVIYNFFITYLNGWMAFEVCFLSLFHVVSYGL